MEGDWLHSLLKVILIPCLLSCLWLADAFAESGPITLNVDVPSGQWKAARLKNLPKDARWLSAYVSNSLDPV